MVLGDARLSLEREQPQQFDLLAVDAFSSDAVPVHLLTSEAFRLYWRHLKPNGVLAVHVSNRYLSLGPVVLMAAFESARNARSVSQGGPDWVLVTNRDGFFDQPEIRRVANPIAPIAGLRTWTDDYSNLFKILR